MTPWRAQGRGERVMAADLPLAWPPQATAPVNVPTLFGTMPIGGEEEQGYAPRRPFWQRVNGTAQRAS